MPRKDRHPQRVKLLSHKWLCQTILDKLVFDISTSEIVDDRFFEQPILNSPYDYPSKHWELDETGQPTGRIIESRRKEKFITPIPKPRKQKAKRAQKEIVFDEGKGLSTEDQQYDLTATINELRKEVDAWRKLSDPNSWNVTPETTRLLQHWRHHRFADIRPFFCQVEAVETAIWLAEVAPRFGNRGRIFLDHIENATLDANPELSRLALKLATGAGKTTVMAMVIAWLTINSVRHPTSKRFTRGFLVVTPGITIRGRYVDADEVLAYTNRTKSPLPRKPGLGEESVRS